MAGIQGELVALLAKEPRFCWSLSRHLQFKFACGLTNQIMRSWPALCVQGNHNTTSCHPFAINWCWRENHIVTETLVETSMALRVWCSSDESLYEAEATYVTNDLAMVHDVHLPATKNDALRLECIFHLHTHSHSSWGRSQMFWPFVGIEGLVIQHIVQEAARGPLDDKVFVMIATMPPSFRKLAALAWALAKDALSSDKLL